MMNRGGERYEQSLTRPAAADDVAARCVNDITVRWFGCGSRDGLDREKDGSREKNALALAVAVLSRWMTFVLAVMEPLV
jgi:hypothetical protein